MFLFFIMAKKRKLIKNLKNRKNLYDSIPKFSLPTLELDPDIKKGIITIILIAIGALGFLSLFGLAGAFGKYFTIFLTVLFGWGRYIVPIIIFSLGVVLFIDGERWQLKTANYIGLFLFIITFHPILHYFVEFKGWETALSAGEGGGYIGYYIALGLVKVAGYYGGLIMFIAIHIIALMLFFNTTLSKLLGRESIFAKAVVAINGAYSSIFNREERDEEEDEEEENEEDEGEDEDEGEQDPEGGEQEEDEEEESGEDQEEEEHEESEDQEEKEDGHELSTQHVFTLAPKDKKGPENRWDPLGIEIVVPLKYLSKKTGKPMSGDISRSKDIIEQTLKNFKISVEMDDTTVGPTVTQYTLRPAEGVKLSRITALNSDLALALAAHPIRIEAPIPGKSLVGVEVPNHIKAVVGLREILTSQEFKEKKSKMAIAIGKDVAGKAWIYDLAKMPHLLVAGATNSGKSVCLNAIIVSLLYQNNPDDMRLIMVDPKQVELPAYNGIPHLLCPVITEADKTISAMRWCLEEMQNRLSLIKGTGKNIADYNLRSKKKLPYIVFIIDELADMMMMGGKDIEIGVQRLTQLARAVGIHMIVATQRPSVNVITGVIKANMPARIAFAVTSAIDSRTILDSSGAEKLIGSGDMLFTAADISKPKRIQGAYISDSEISNIVNYIKRHGKGTHYLDEVTARRGSGMNGASSTGMSQDEDPLYSDALELVFCEGKASTSLFQRKLEIGYGRAAKILDSLEREGIVGPSNGSKPRELLVSKEEYYSASAQLAGIPIHNRDEAKAPERYLEGRSPAFDNSLESGIPQIRRALRDRKSQVERPGADEDYEDEEEVDGEDEEDENNDEDNDSEENEESEIEEDSGEEEEKEDEVRTQKSKGRSEDAGEERADSDNAEAKNSRKDNKGRKQVDIKDENEWKLFSR